MTFNVKKVNKEVNKEVKETKELSPIIEFLKEFEDKLFYGVECDREIPDKEFYIKTAKELVRELYKLDGEDSKDLCKNCSFKWLIMNSKEIC